MNIYVGNLSWTLKDQDLQDLFSQYGEISSAKIVLDKFTNRSKGFGFVEFEDPSNNQKAVDELNGKELDGRAINVSIAKPKEDRPRRDGNGGGFRGGDRGGDRGGNSFRQRSW